MPDENITKNRYSPELTAQIRKAAVADVLLAQTDLLRKSETKTDLNNLDAVKRVADQYIETCASVGICPAVEGLFAQLGVSRTYGYRFLREHQKSETAEYLNRLRLMWTSTRMALGESRVLDPALTIFILKNSDLGFADKHEIEVAQQVTPLDTLDEQTSRARWIGTLPEPIDE